VRHDVRDRHEQQQDERHGREQRVEGERAREEGDVVLVGDLEGATEEATGGEVPPPAFGGAAQASGSS
jgi:hypothetical protein